MKILVVEDDKKALAFLKQGLSEQGYDVVEATTGDQGLSLALQTKFDVMILDVMLPGRDGFQLLKDLRAHEVRVPVLMLTARDAVEDRVQGLELGADDYLVKPFAFAELCARLRTILRRSGEILAEVKTFGELELDLVRRRATRGTTALELTPTEFNLLTLLAQHSGKPLTRMYLAEQVWGLTVDPGTNVVDVHVRRLRAKVDDPYEFKYIRTVRGIGYAFDVNE